MNKNYQFIDEIYQQTNNMLENILISIILYNFCNLYFAKKRSDYTYNNS